MTAPRDVKVVAWRIEHSDGRHYYMDGPRDPREVHDNGREHDPLVLQSEAARALADVEAEVVRLRDALAFGQDGLTAELESLIHRAETAEAALAAAIALLREAEPFVGWTGAPEGLTNRIGDYLDAALAGQGAGS